MNVFEFDPAGLSWEEIAEQQRLRRQYIRDALDPNEAADDGRTLLLLAVCYCSTQEGQELFLGLLDRGADPNKPTAAAIFTSLLMASSSMPLVEKLVEKGLRLNDVYESNEFCRASEDVFTLLDYLYWICGKISRKRKALNALSDKHAGGLGERRQFIEDVIALLESHGAKRAKELNEEPSSKE
jgi:hypothetical protein